MRFEPTPLAGAYTIHLEKRGDSRGFFARSFCEKEFAAAGLETRFVQMNNSLNARKGTLRGMHYQVQHAQGKQQRSAFDDLYGHVHPNRLKF